ncbi:MAG: LPS assembly lipoprotein LptE [Candidatus Aceula meridiana]|nr:LPS assembly lipoprotein LptE [Candidatus Aceula meridiana]
MKKVFFGIISFFLLVTVSGCGYSVRTLSPYLSSKDTIYVAPIENTVDYSSERRQKSLYIPLMEVKVSNAVTNRFIFDGNLKIAKEGNADLILKGKLLNYQRDVLRRDDNDDAEEYRIRITVSLVLFDSVEEENVWVEPNFSGDATYFLTGSNAKSEGAAIDEAIKDLAKRIVDRTIEDW